MTESDSYRIVTSHEALIHQLPLIRNVRELLALREEAVREERNELVDICDNKIEGLYKLLHCTYETLDDVEERAIGIIFQRILTPIVPMDFPKEEEFSHNLEQFFTNPVLHTAVEPFPMNALSLVQNASIGQFISIQEVLLPENKSKLYYHAQVMTDRVAHAYENRSKGFRADPKDIAMDPITGSIRSGDEGRVLALIGLGEQFIRTYGFEWVNVIPFQASIKK